MHPALQHVAAILYTESRHRADQAPENPGFPPDNPHPTDPDPTTNSPTLPWLEPDKKADSQGEPANDDQNQK